MSQVDSVFSNFDIDLSDQKTRRAFIRKTLISGIQNVHTPFALCSEMIKKLEENIEKSENIKDKDILVLFNIEFVEVMISEFGISPDKITYFSDSKGKSGFAKYIYKVKGIIDVGDNVLETLEKVSKNMKFDCVVMNPPYQTPTENKGSGHTLWDGFVRKAFEITKDDGCICAVHPCGWRRISGSFLSLGNEMRNKNIRYIEIHDITDGQKTFGVCTRYDWYVMQNCKNQGDKTTIIGDDGAKTEIDLTSVACIPNGQFDKIFNILAKNTSDKVEIVFDRSNYGADKKWVNENEDNTFKYPCIYSLPQKGMQLRWSSINTKGHFGIPKVITSYGACPQVVIDKKGEYGLTQWAFGIADDVKNLPKIKAALESPEFIELCKSMRFTLDRYDPNFISGLKKDFWKEFV